MITRQNVISPAELVYEYDAIYLNDPVYTEDDYAESAGQKIVLQGSSDPGALDGCSYINVVPDYDGELSPGQRELYESLLQLQSSSVYVVTSVGKLAESLGLKVPFAIETRLECLQSYGAISGLSL